MKENKKLIIAIIAVIAIVIVVFGATYAYWLWNSNNNERTLVNLTVPNSTEALSATIDGGTMSVSDLAQQHLVLIVIMLANQQLY